MRECVIVGGARTPFGKLGGGLKDTQAVELGGEAISGSLDRASLESGHVDHVIMGMVLQAGAGQNPARQAARHAGLDWSVTAETINKVCASGMRSVTMADQIIRAGDAEVIVAGGMESMSNAPYLASGTRWGARIGHQVLIDGMLKDGLECPFHQVHMIVHASRVAEEYGISRNDQDEWAIRSQQRAVASRDKGYFAEEIVPVPVPSRSVTLSVSEDEAPRPDTSLDKLSALPPLFDVNGSITAGAGDSEAAAPNRHVARANPPIRGERSFRGGCANHRQAARLESGQSEREWRCHCARPSDWSERRTHCADPGA
jgi:acetyl-CoA C-acetyltransferase